MYFHCVASEVDWDPLGVQGLEELLPHLRMDHELAGPQHPYFDLPVSNHQYHAPFPGHHLEPAPYHHQQRHDLHVSEVSP